MTPEGVFAAVNGLALACWLLLAILPNRRWVTDTVASLAVPAFFAVAYSGLIGARWAGASGGFSSLADVAALFQDPWLLLAGWIHYLAFDLLVGSFEARDAQARGLPRYLLIPCLFFTFMFGPAGWLLYTALTRGREPRFTLAR
ncbi:MAG: ABA4-like family protein [Vicinamibacterales bacterium]